MDTLIWNWSSYWRGLPGRLCSPLRAQGLVCIERLLSLSLIFLLSGCAHWSREETSTKAPLLNPPKQTPDTVIIEAVMIRFPEEQAQELAKIWQVVDESNTEISVRRELNANGIQCGVLVGEMPQVVRTRLKELSASDPTNSLERLGLAAEVISDTQRVHCHAGKRKELSLRPGLSESLTIIHSQQGVIRGNEYSQPHVLLDLRAVPLGDGRAKLKMTPEIEHGEPQEVFLANQIGHRSEVRRQQQRWEYLAMEATLAPGQFFFCTLTDPPRGLGQGLFTTRTSERTTERVLLVIRLMSTQLDELFAPEEVEVARRELD